MRVAPAAMVGTIVMFSVVMIVLHDYFMLAVAMMIMLMPMLIMMMLMNHRVKLKKKEMHHPW